MEQNRLWLNLRMWEEPVRTVRGDVSCERIQWGLWHQEWGVSSPAGASCESSQRYWDERRRGGELLGQTRHRKQTKDKRDNKIWEMRSGDITMHTAYRAWDLGDLWQSYIRLLSLSYIYFPSKINDNNNYYYYHHHFLFSSCYLS